MEIRIEQREEYSSRQLAAEMLAAAAKTDPENIRFYRGKNGKPLSDLPYFFNCSHSGEYVACAVSRREIGVDLEKVRPVHARLLRTLTDREKAWLESLPREEWDRAFLRLWTMKESWIKCRSGTVWEYKQCNFVFSKETGTGLFQYINEVRMKRAGEMIRSNKQAYIKEVAAAVGFDDPYFFSRKFKDFYGKTPSEYAEA